MAWPSGVGLVAAFVLGWLTRNLLHRALNRKMHGVLDLVAALVIVLMPNAADLQLLARLVRALIAHAAWERPGWCPVARQEVRDLIARLETAHAPAREDLRETTVPSER